MSTEEPALKAAAPSTAAPDEWSDAALDAQPVLGHRGLRRLGWAAVVLLAVVLLAVLPPLINVSRYQHRVAQSISASIGRPVHFDEIHLHLLPLPSLTIQNFVVEEDPAFGVEPAMRANTVEARLRLASLWRRRVEVSHIRLQAPSINLVRRDDGRWNLQGVVSQAGTLQTAPTAQRRASEAPRFPYVEATEARINIKAGETKLPWSLVDAKLALWLPDQNEWRVRLNGRPLRTDTDVSDVGELRLEGSLGRDTTGVPAGLMHQPLALSASWASTPLGETAKLVLGRDTGFRGAASAEVEVRGTPAKMHLTTDLHLRNLRRTEFVPRLPMSINAHCETEAIGVVHQLHNLRCGIPTAQSEGLFDGVFRSRAEQVLSAPDVLSVKADVPDLTDLRTASAEVALQNGSPEYFLNWLRVFSSRIPEGVQASGRVQLQAGTVAGHPGWNGLATCDCVFSGPALAEVPGSSQSWTIVASRSDPPTGGDRTPWRRRAAIAVDGAYGLPSAEKDRTSLTDPITKLDPRLFHGTVDGSGYRIRYDSWTTALLAGKLLPPLMDNAPEDLTATPGHANAPGDIAVAPGRANAPGTATATRGHAEITAERTWGQPQHWTAAPVPNEPATHRKRRR